MSTPDPSLLLPPLFVESLRDIATKAERDTIAVIVLTGTPERGLAMSVSSRESEEETIRLLLATVLDDVAEDAAEALDVRRKQ